MNERMKEILAVCLTVLIAVSIVMGVWSMAGIKHATTGDGTKLTDNVWAAAHVCGSDESMLLKPKTAWGTALALLNQGAIVDWTDLDLTTYTSAAAKLALIKLRIYFDAGAATYYFQVRTNGTTPTRPDTMWVVPAEAVANTYKDYQCIITLDTNQVIEYSFAVEGGAQADFYIDVIAYWE